jgi:PAS domain S-box-containing protein
MLTRGDWEGITDAQAVLRYCGEAAPRRDPDHGAARIVTQRRPEPATATAEGPPFAAPSGVGAGQMAVLVIEVDGRGIVSRAAPAVERALCYPPGALQGLRFDQIAHPGALAGEVTDDHVDLLLRTGFGDSRTMPVRMARRGEGLEIAFDPDQCAALAMLDALPVAAYLRLFRSDGGSQVTGNRHLWNLAGARPRSGIPPIELWERLIHPDDRAEIAQVRKRVVEGEQGFRLQYRLRTLDGGLRWLLHEESRSGFDEGRPAWIGVMTDITPQMDALAARELSERRFKAMVQYSSDAVTVRDAAGACLYASPASGMLLGYEPGKISPERLDDLLHPDDRPVLAAAITECLETGEIGPFTLRYRDREGAWRSFETVGTNLLDDQAVGGIVFNARDVTDRLAVEKDLRDSERQFHEFMDRTPVLALMKDRHGRYIYANRKLQEWCGVDPAALIGKRAADWRDPDLAALAEEDDVHVLASGETLERMDAWPDVRGGSRELLTIKFPILRDGSEPLIGVVGIDLSEQKRAAEVERFLAAIVTSAEEAIIARTLDGMILSWNAGAERLFGYSSMEMIGQPVAKMIPPDELALAEEANGEVADGAFVGPIEARRVRKDGSLVDVAYTLSPIRDEAGETIATVAIARDFSEPMAVREALRRANEDLERRVAERTQELSEVNHRLTENLDDLEVAQSKLREQAKAFQEQAHLLDLAHDAIVVTDARTGEITYWNQGAQDVYGWREEEVEGQPVEQVLRPVYPEHSEEIRRELYASGAWAGDLEHQRRDGSRIKVESRWALERDDEGRPRTIMTINRDLTEREALLRSVQDSEQRVRELAEMRDDFVAMAAHEMASPVAAIRWFAEVLGMGEMSADEASHASKTIVAEAEMLQTLLDDVRAIARIDTDDFSVKPRAIDIALLVRNAEAHAKSLPGNHPFTFDIETQGMVMADDKRIGQVLRNLMNNAAKYTPSGTPVALRMTDGGDRVKIEVSDEGPGISLEDQKVIFEKYRRGSQTAGTKVHGAGIGLYVCSRIVAAHGSSLTVESEPGHGAAFRFDLPRVP